jgi:hypothetical protein
VAITLGAATLAFVIGRRERRRSLARVTAALPVGEATSSPLLRGTPEELERLRRALAEVDD